MSNKAYLNPAIVSHLIEIKADESPDKPIMTFEAEDFPAEVLTYRNLYENSNKLARMLLQNGIGKGDVFGVFMRNHPEFAYSLLAGPVIGAILVPIDPRSSGDRLVYLLRHSKAKLVILTSDKLDAVRAIRDAVPDIRFVVSYRKEYPVEINPAFPALDEVLEADSWQRVDQQVMDVRHPMQVIYTSGTTGDPKGVMIRNNRIGLFNIVTKLVWKYRSDDILYTGLSLSHGNAQAVTFFPSIMAGIRSVFSPGFTKSRIWDICRTYGCTTFSLLGGMMAGIFNKPPKPNDADNPVKVVISAGTPSAIWEDFEKRFDVKILEWYGAVEGGFAYKPPGVGPIGSFGKPLPGMMEFKVVDENDQEVLPGTVGELIVRMTKGETRVDYLDNVAASEEKTRGGWLRTGDMVHRDKDGWYFFHHRKGSELRRAGDFIQPDQIERVIGEHPDVSEVCVYGVPAQSGAPGESDIVAAVVPSEGRSIDPAALFSWCAERLSPNFVPSWLQVVDVIPKTISEKALDRVLREAFRVDGAKVYKRP